MRRKQLRNKDETSTWQTRIERHTIYHHEFSVGWSSRVLSLMLLIQAIWFSLFHAIFSDDKFCSRRNVGGNYAETNESFLWKINEITVVCRFKSVALQRKKFLALHEKATVGVEKDDEEEKLFLTSRLINSQRNEQSWLMKDLKSFVRT